MCFSFDIFTTCTFLKVYLSVLRNMKVNSLLVHLSGLSFHEYYSICLFIFFLILDFKYFKSVKQCTLHLKYIYNRLCFHFVLNNVMKFQKILHEVRTQVYLFKVYYFRNK